MFLSVAICDIIIFKYIIEWYEIDLFICDLQRTCTLAD